MVFLTVSISFMFCKGSVEMELIYFSVVLIEIIGSVYISYFTTKCMKNYH